MTAQEIYYGELRANAADAYTYWGGTGGQKLTPTSTQTDFSVAVSTGVTIQVYSDGGGETESPAQWHAVATHAATDDTCDVFVGVELTDKPSEAVHSNTPGVIACGKPDDDDSGA
jgi:hypothetical protein